MPSVANSIRVLPIVSAFLLLACGGTGTAAPEYSAQEGRSGGDTTALEESAEAEEVIPHGQLPEGVTPLSYSLWMEVVPERPTFRGRVQIQVRLEEQTSLIWLHGRELNVTEAEILPEGEEPVSATFRQEDEEGTASLRLAAPVGPGEALISLTYEAPFDTQLKGLYRVEAADEAYAFTQFEATSARLAFPCFDEPRFKTPFEMTLSVREDHEAIANTRALSTQSVGAGMKEVRFATTERLPTYLIAMAVGNLDIVEADPIAANDVRSRPLPLRGVAVHGQGVRLAYALEHTGELLAELEDYFGIEYPYDKLDIIAVPDFASGAMENAGAITFREVLLLLDPDEAPERQRRGFTYVMAHELAHQWFGNLVTMAWWDDIWLNEAFATWMGNRVVERTHPEFRADVGMLRSVHGAMLHDSRLAARQIRQPIESNHDIRNAFDSITYRKGGGVLAMFEAWMGAETFREGLREYMNRHRFGTGTSDDLLDAFSQMAGRDVGTPFRTFLEQPGVPLIEAVAVCEGSSPHIQLTQRRYLPVGSAADAAQVWQVPVCVRFGQSNAEGEQACTLLTEGEGSLPFESGTCPDWWMPNSDAAGYYRWSMSAEALEQLMERGFEHLSERERLSVASNLVAGARAGATDVASVLAHVAVLARDPARSVMVHPMGLIAELRDHHLDASAHRNLDAWASGLYSRRLRRMGMSPRRGRTEDGETALRRRDMVSFLTYIVPDQRVIRDTAALGRNVLGLGRGRLSDGELHLDAAPRDLIGNVLAMAVREGGAEVFDALLAHLNQSQDALFRSHAIRALASTHDPALAARALALGLDSNLRVNEVTTALGVQLNQPETRAAAWTWMTENFDTLFGRVASTRAGYAPHYAGHFCSLERVQDVQAFFGPRIEALPGGPRNLAQSLEDIQLCAAYHGRQAPSAAVFFAARP